jgi:propionyl-CoA synthetase
VVGIQDDLKGQVPMALVVLISGENMEHFQLEHEIIQLVREKIGAVAALRNVLIVERLPKTRSGKILRKLLRGIIDKEDYQIPSTIDDVSIVDEIKNALRIYFKAKKKEQKKTKP